MSGAYSAAPALVPAVPHERSRADLLDSVVDSLAEGVVVVDGAGRVVIANPAARVLLGDTLSLHRAPAPRLLLADEVTPVPAEQSPLALVARGETFADVVFCTPGPDGRRWISATARPLVDGPGGVLLLRDATERRVREQQQERLLDQIEATAELKQRFIEGVSHELRTPLTSLVGYANLLLRRTAQLTSRQAEYVGEILQGAERLRRVVDAMLAFREDDPVQTVDIGGEDLRALVDDAADRVRDDLRPGVRLLTHVAPDLPPLLVDEARLGWVLDELLQNAANHTTRGRVAVDVTVEGDELLCVRVSDTGCGISASYAELVFDAFFQIEPGIGSRRGGLGLGLARARGRARAMGGSLSLESEPGRGSRFTLRVPLELL